MTVLKVDGMHCMMCVSRIEKALKAVGLDFSVNLEQKTVTVSGSDADVKTAVAELDDLGFDAIVE